MHSDTRLNSDEFSNDGDVFENDSTTRDSLLQSSDNIRPFIATHKKTTKYVCFASAMAALGGVLFGYDVGMYKVGCG